MSLLKKAIKKVNENCDFQGVQGGVNPNTLMTFLVRRNAADEEEVAADPVGPSPEGEDAMDAQLIKFFADNPSPSNEEVRELATQAGMEYKELRGRIYQLLHSLASEKYAEE